MLRKFSIVMVILAMIGITLVSAALVFDDSDLLIIGFPQTMLGIPILLIGPFGGLRFSLVARLG